MDAIKRIYAFYRDGFRAMTVGRTLWLVIAIKLFIMFAILKVFFFPDFLGRLRSDEQRSDYVREQLIRRTAPVFSPAPAPETGSDHEPDLN